MIDIRRITALLESKGIEYFLDDDPSEEKTRKINKLIKELDRYKWRNKID